MSQCTYCSVTSEEAWIATKGAVAVPHPKPFGTCHMVVAPRRHVASLYALDVAEQQELWAMVTEIRARISRSMRLDGFHLGFMDFPENEESHACVHVLPRVAGESLMLPGGIEWVDPDRP